VDRFLKDILHLTQICSVTFVTGRSDSNNHLKLKKRAGAAVLRWRAWMGAGDRMRRIVDIAGALVLLVFSLPLLAAIALAIKCETPGPLLERQPRIGRGGRRFELLSFRTTRYDPTRCRTRLPGERTRVGTVLHYTVRIFCRSFSMSFRAT
jgi:lipopolysaccharide/colanic/teichoic acid biosynthesis glycosyltransferase